MARTHQTPVETSGTSGEAVLGEAVVVGLSANGATGTTPTPPSANPIETVILAVDRCLGRTPADQRYRKTLAAWLASRHPEHPEAWWLGQWGI